MNFRKVCLFKLRQIKKSKTDKLKESKLKKHVNIAKRTKHCLIKCNFN